MQRGLRYLSRQAFEILPPTPAERHCVLHLHISHNTTWFWGGKRDVLWETCKREMPDLDIAVIHAVTQKLLADVTRKF